MAHPKRVYELTTDLGRRFWVLATSPERAISKMKCKGKALLDRGEKIDGSREVGTIEVE